MDINATLFGQMITFAIFVWFTMKYVWPMLTKVLKERQEKIAEGLSAAERGHKELEIAQKNAVKHLREAKTQAQQMIDQAKRQASMIVEQAKQDANHEKEKILSLGQAELAQQFRLAEEKLRGEIVNLVTVSTEKLLQRTLSPEDQKALLEIKKKEIYG